MKGQKSRSGVSIKPLFQGGCSTLIDHMKKKRGFKSRNADACIVKLSSLDKKFKDGDVVGKESLIKSGIVSKIKSGKIKILESFDLKKKIKVEKEIFISASAKKSIEKAGGEILK